MDKFVIGKYIEVNKGTGVGMMYVDPDPYSDSVTIR